MDFRILGPLEVVEKDRPLAVTGAKRRILLAVLCLHANEAVSSDRLVDALWGEQPPAKAQTALQFHVAQLRRLLGPERIETRPPGYLLRLSPDELDAARFERLLAARDGDREPSLRAALALWRGPALADFVYEPFAQAEIARLEELRLAALEERIEDDVARARHAEVVGELEALVREQPLRERLRAQLMLALYRCGRQAEALGVYRQTRELLVEELGIEPGPALQRLEREILNQHPDLAPPAAEPPATSHAPPEPREERKVVTALFCDLVGPSEHADPEEARAVLAPFYMRLRAELERHGGTVERFAGDAVMALFGAPVAHEDDPERAVRAALGIRDWIAEQPERLQARIGIATGAALVRVGVPPDPREALASGGVVSAAMRILEAAPPGAGAVAVGEATYRATRAAIAYEELEPAEPRGEPTMPLRRWAARQARGRQVTQAGRTAPFIGRADDLAVLMQAHARTLRESSAQLVTVVGEPGIGKTRLVGEFERLARERGDPALWHHGRCLSYGEGITFWALGQIVSEHAGILDSDSPQEVAGKLARAVEPIAAEADRVWLRVRLGALVGSGDRRRPVEQEEAFPAWRTFLEGVAAHQPLVLVFEDLHWADSALLAFLAHLVDGSPDVALLIVCTARPELYEREPGWGGGKRNSTTISLSPLTARDTARLVGALLEQATLPADVQAALLDRADGNPLFAEEFVRMLGDRGVIERRNGAITVASDADLGVPESVQALIAARLDTLSADRKALLHDASVVGKVFSADALASMGHVPKEAVLEGLHELVRKELVRSARRSSLQEDVEYSFWHVLIRDVAYAQIPRAERARQHVAAAEWIEHAAGERVADHAEFLANHFAAALELFRAAGEHDEAEALAERTVELLVLAGDRAIRLDQALGARYYTRALELLPERDRQWRPRVLARAADAATKSGGRFDQIKRDLEEAIGSLSAQGDVFAAANAMRQLSFAIFIHGEHAEDRLALAEEACRLLEREPPGPELALVYERVINEHLVCGRHEEVIRSAERALPLLERFGLDDEALGTRSRVATSRWSLGDLGGLEEARAVARAAVDPERGYGTVAAVTAMNNLADAEHWVGAGSAAALERGRATVELASRRGLERPARWSMGSLAEFLYDLGEWDDALRIEENIAAWEREYGRGVVGTLAPPYAVRILAARGELAAAATLVGELLPRARELQDLPISLPAVTAAALVEVARGDSSSALSLVEEAVELIAERTDPLRLAYVSDIGRVCAAASELFPLQRLLEASPSRGARCANLAVSGRALLSEANGAHEDAESLYAQAAQRWEDRGSVVEQAYALLGLARCRLALGRGGDAAQPAREAQAVFARLGARALVAEAEELLGRGSASGS